MKTKLLLAVLMAAFSGTAYAKPGVMTADKVDCKEVIEKLQEESKVDLSSPEKQEEGQPKAKDVT